MRVKKRKKSRRFRGSKTHGRGFKKKARGSGHRGGFGMSGTGKRADHRKTLVLNMYGNDYFGKDKALRKGKILIKPGTINLRDIEQNLKSFIKKGIAKSNKGDYEINLRNHKILGEGDVKLKMIIHARSASKSAIEKVKKHG